MLIAVFFYPDILKRIFKVSIPASIWLIDKNGSHYRLNQDKAFGNVKGVVCDAQYGGGSAQPQYRWQVTNGARLKYAGK